MERELTRPARSSGCTACAGRCSSSPTTSRRSSRPARPGDRGRRAGTHAPRDRGADIARDPVAWLAEVEAATLDALRTRGEATANELGADEPRLRTQMLFNVGKKYEGSVGVSTRLLYPLAMEGRIARGRPAGSWVSSQYRWVPIEAVLPGGYPSLDPPAARTEIVRRWLATFGPGTVADIRWWTGWTLAEVRRILAELDVVEVDLDDATGLVLARRPGSTVAHDPFAAFLPGLDPTVMGWTDRRFFLGRPWPAPLRHERQRRADRLVGRPDRGWLGPAARRRGRPPAPRGRGCRRRGGDRGRA